MNRRGDEGLQPVWNVIVRSAAYFEMRAEETPVIAERTGDPWCRKVLEGIAEDYIRFAGDPLNLERVRRRLIDRPRAP